MLFLCPDTASHCCHRASVQPEPRPGCSTTMEKSPAEQNEANDLCKTDTNQHAVCILSRTHARSKRPRSKHIEHLSPNHVASRSRLTGRLGGAGPRDALKHRLLQFLFKRLSFAVLQSSRMARCWLPPKWSVMICYGCKHMLGTKNRGTQDKSF